MTGPDTAPALGSVSAVMVVEDSAPEAAVLTEWGDALAALFADVELVIVANGVPSPVALRLEALATVVSDLTIHFLADRVDQDTARLVGLDTALGDWVLLAEPSPDRLPAVRRLTERARGGYQVISAIGPAASADRPAYQRLESLYFGLYGSLTRRDVLHPAPTLRLYSRAAALFIAGSAEGEMLLRSADVAGGLPACVERLDGLAGDPPRRRTLLAAASKAIGALLNGTTVPLRLASLIALVSGVLSLLYSLYVVIVYLLKPDILPGWTTLSLQISGMMLLFSMLFALMAEYVLGIYRGVAPRRRHVITRELRSPARRYAARLNVVDQSGAFQIGMPEDARP